MDDDLVSISEQRFSRSMPKSVSGAGDENTSFPVGVQRRWRRSLFFRGFRGLRDGPCGCQKRTCGYPKAYPSPATRNLRRSMDEPWFSSEFWVVCKVDVWLGHLGRLPEDHPRGSALLHPEFGEADTNVDVLPGRGQKDATRPRDDRGVAVDAHPVFLVGERLVLVLPVFRASRNSAFVSTAAFACMKVRSSVIIESSEATSPASVAARRLSWAARTTCSVSSAARVGAAERTDQAMTSRVVTIRPAQSQPTLAFLICPVLLDSIGVSGQRSLPHMQVAVEPEDDIGCLDDGRRLALLETQVARTVENSSFHSLSPFIFAGYRTVYPPSTTGSVADHKACVWAAQPEKGGSGSQCLSVRCRCAVPKQFQDTAAVSDITRFPSRPILLRLAHSC